MSVPTQSLDDLLRDLESHVARDGWDQPVRLFALVDTEELLRREPGLALPAEPGPLTAVEQDALPAGDLDQLLATIAWPPAVRGTALVHEVLVLPPEAETQLPADDPTAFALAHPARREVRMAAAVLRDGTRAACLRLRGAGEEHLLTGPALAPGLCAGLLATLD